jgi:hypothetical protein
MIENCRSTNKPRYINHICARTSASKNQSYCDSPYYGDSSNSKHIFVNNVAKIAEKLDHHPIITINWKSVKLSLKSFDVDAITNRDINFAKEIEKIDST